MTYIQEVEFNSNFLDSLPLPKPENGENLLRYEKKIEEMFEHSEMPEEMQGCILNFMDSYDLGKYLERRFGVKIQEEITYAIVS